LLLLARNTIAGIRIEAFSNRRKHLKKKKVLSLNGSYRSNDIYVTGKFPEIFDPSAFIRNERNRQKNLSLNHGA
jgi:hypothetical protein